MNLNFYEKCSTHFNIIFIIYNNTTKLTNLFISIDNNTIFRDMHTISTRSKMSPFIEARIITCLDPKLDVLKSLEKRFTRYNQVQISWTEKNGSDPKLRVQFLSEQAFSENFRENKLVFTTFIQFLAAKSLEIRDLRPNVKRSTNSKKTNYLMIRYRTDITIFFQYYKYRFQILQLLGLHVMYEELHDGILIFFQSNQDFIDASMDLMDFQYVRQYLKEKNLWNPVFKDFIQQFQD